MLYSAARVEVVVASGLSESVIRLKVMGQCYLIRIFLHIGSTEMELTA